MQKLVRRASFITEVGFCIKAKLLNQLHHARQALCGRLELIRCQYQHGGDACLKGDRSRVNAWQDLQAQQAVRMSGNGKQVSGRTSRCTRSRPSEFPGTEAYHEGLRCTLSALSTRELQPSQTIPPTFTSSSIVSIPTARQAIQCQRPLFVLCTAEGWPLCWSRRYHLVSQLRLQSLLLILV